VHDAISVEQLGIASACVITDGFVPTARMMAELLGLPGYACVVVSHPISHNTDAELRAKAEQIVAQAVAILRDRVPATASAANGLTTLRQMLQADKSDLELLGIDNGTARLKLVLDDPACADCVMPRSYLEPMILQHLQRSHPEVQRVELDDPRA
jgi:Fe-S cluster biogenesis protein NfuA